MWGFRYICRFRSAGEVLAAIANGADVHERNAENRPPLYDACIQNNAAAVEVLIANGADVHDRDKHFMTPLHWAVRGFLVETPEALAVLIAAGADVAATDINGMSPLHHASQREKSGAVRLLLEAGAPMTTDKKGRTPLVLACARRRHRGDAVKTLIEFGADVNQKNDTGTPLSLAARYGHYYCVEALIDAGADVAEDIESPNSPLYKACKHNHSGCADLLIRAGIPADHRWPHASPLSLACKRPNCEKLLDVLIRGGADVNECVDDDAWPLIQLVRRCRRPRLPYNCTGEAAVSRLIAAGANVNCVDSADNTALHYACDNGHPEIVAALLIAGANPRALNTAKKRPGDLTTDPAILAMFEPRVKSAAI